MKLQVKLRSDYTNYIRPLFIKNKCDLCGDTEDLELHHHKQFDSMLRETLKELNLQYYDTTESYTDIQVRLIRNIMLGKQVRCKYNTLCSKCHSKVHNGEQAKEYYNIKAIEKENKHKKYINDVVIPYLETIVGKPLYKEDRKELINIIDLRDSSRHLLKSISVINSYLSENFNYTVTSKRIRINGKQIRVWVISKIGYYEL